MSFAQRPKGGLGLWLSCGVISAIGLWGLAVWAQTGAAPKAGSDAVSAKGHTATLYKEMERAHDLLEKEDYVEFFEDFLPIDELRNLRRETRVKVAAAQFKLRPEAKEKVAVVKKLLKASKGAKITLSNDDSVAYVLITLVPEKKPVTKKPEAPKVVATPKSVSVPGLGSDRAKMLTAAAKLIADETPTEAQLIEFVQKTYPVGDVQRMTINKSFDEVTLRLNAYPLLRTSMQADLEQMAKSQAKMNGANEAEYTLPASAERSVPQRSVKLQLVDGHWRFFDHGAALRSKAGSATSGGGDEADGPETFALQFERIGKAWRFQTMEPEYADPDSGPPPTSSRAYPTKQAAPAPAVTPTVPAELPADVPVDEGAAAPAVESPEKGAAFPARPKSKAAPKSKTKASP